MSTATLNHEIKVTRAIIQAFAAPWDRSIGRGKCYGADDPDLWTPDNDVQLAAAQAVCGSCPIATQCLRIGTARKENGVWGGRLLMKGEPYAIESRQPPYGL